MHPRPRLDLSLRARGRPARMLGAALLALVLPRAHAGSTDAPPATRWVTVRESTVVQPLQAYGRIEPMAVLRLRASEAGTLRGMHLVPGDNVRAGEGVARIAGPAVRAAELEARQAVRAAQARERAAQQVLRSVRRQFDAQLATVQAVDAARGEFDAARAARRAAEAKWQALLELGTLRAPLAASVLAVQAADGERVELGQPVATLQPAGHLWLRAVYYGADAARLRVGMTGRLRPSGGLGAGAAHAGVGVRVVAISPQLAADGGERVDLLPLGPAPPPWWVSGQWGEVTLDGPARRVVMVPTQALVLDRARWWVLVHTAAGDRPRRVVPGRAQGWRTAIVSGLREGEQVVVDDAFLEYHRGIAGSYAPPD